MYEIFEKLLKEHGYTVYKVAKETGIANSTFSDWKKGISIPKSDKLSKIADFFGVSTDYLLGNEKPKRKGVLIPVYGDIAAGIPIEAIEDIIDYEEITPEMAATGEFFCLRVKGDSMAPRILENDVVVVRKQSDVDSGSLAAVLINGCSATLKKIKKAETGIVLIPFNDAYGEMTFTYEQVEQLPVMILGKVVELRGKFY